jgi:hypothetical protein
VTGNPFTDLRGYELCMNSREYTGFSLYRRFDVPITSPFRFLLGNMVSTLGRLNDGARTMQSEVLSYPDLYIAGAFLFGLLLRAGSEESRRLKWTLALAVGVAFVFAAIRNPTLATRSSSALYAFSPLLAVFGVATVVEMVRRLEIHVFFENLVLAAVALMVAIPLLTTIAKNVAEGRPAGVKYVPPAIETIVKETPEGTVIYTDSPWLVAWYAKRPAVWLPQRPADIRDVTERIPMRVGCLTSLLSAYTQEEGFDYWKRLYGTIQAPEGYQVARFFPEGGSWWYIFARPGVFKPIPGASPAAGGAGSSPEGAGP